MHVSNDNLEDEDLDLLWKKFLYCLYLKEKQLTSDDRNNQFDRYEIGRFIGLNDETTDGIVNVFIHEGLVTAYLDNKIELTKTGKIVIENILKNADKPHADAPFSDLDDEFRINRWDLWHSYSSYFLEGIKDLKSTAKDLVKYNLCKVVYCSDGTLFWKNESGVQEYKVNVIDRDPDSKASYKFPKGIEKDEDALFYADQAIRMAYFEHKVYHEEYSELYPYIRGFINTINLTEAGRKVLLYPQIKLYQTGTLLVQFRSLSGEQPSYIEPLIRHDINLGRRIAQNTNVPPEIIKLSMRSFYLDSRLQPVNHPKILNRYRLRGYLSAIDYVIDNNTIHDDGNNYSFNTKHLSFYENEEPDVNLEYLMNSILSSVSYILNKPNEGLKFIIFGSNHNKYNLGHYWIGRPCIYLLQYSNQPEIANKIVESNGEELGRILSKIELKEFGNFNKFIGKNLRSGDDYCHFMNKGLTLIAYCNNEISKHIIDGKTNADLICERQIVNESIDYFNMCYHRIAEKSDIEFDLIRSILFESKTILNNKKFLVKLNSTYNHVSSYGDINEVHEYACQIFDWKGLTKQIEDQLKITNDSIAIRNEKFRMVALIISILSAIGFFSIVFGLFNNVKDAFISIINGSK